MKNYFKKILGKYFKSFAYFYRRLRYRVFVRVALSISVGVLDGLGLAMFLPLLHLTLDPSSTGSEGLGKLDFLVNGIEGMGLNINLFSVLMIMSFFFILKGLAQYINNMYDVNLRQYYIKTIRIDLSNLLSKMTYKAFVNTDAGRIQNTMSGEVLRISKAYQSYFGTYQQTVLVLVYILFAFYIDARFALLICIGGGLTNFIYKGIYKSTKISSKLLTRNTHKYQGLILQFVSNFKYLKATRYIREYNRKLKSSIQEIEDNNKRIGHLNSIIIAIREPILILVVSTVILIHVMVLNGSVATILISLLFFYRALAALILLQTFYNDFLAVSGSLESITKFEDELKNSQELKGTQKITDTFSSIELKNIGLEYSGDWVLKDISLKVEAPQTIAFVGGSGSGKTTLLNVITGLIPVSRGEIYINGISGEKLNMETYQRRIGYITQEPVIFTDSIFNNITFWAEPTAENYERYFRAVKKASILEFISNLPKKENTLLGNSGINLSGGQRQRISIARELFKDIDILILDEATSSLDSETEETIQKEIKNLQGQYTILMVAHRLSTIKHADKIIVMSKGAIIDEGDYESLVLKSAKFQKMVHLQEI